MIGDIFPDGWTIRTVDGKGQATWDQKRSCWLIIDDNHVRYDQPSLAMARSFFDGIGRPLETEIERTTRLNRLTKRT